MYKEKLKFNADGKFTILQVSDAQDMHIPRKGMFKMLDKIYDKVNPDLIVLTGDNILGNHIDDAFPDESRYHRDADGPAAVEETARYSIRQDHPGSR